MTNRPGFLSKGSLSRASIAGAILAVLGIVLFALLWTALSNAGVSAFPRLIIALCVPPGAMAALVGLYILAVPRKNTSKAETTEEVTQASSTQ